MTNPFETFRNNVLKPGIYYKVDRNPNYSQVTREAASLSDLQELMTRKTAGGDSAVLEGAVTANALIVE